MSAAIDFSAGYTLASDLVVFRRNETTIQIGTEAPRRVLIANAPPHATDILAHLRDATSLLDAINSLGGDTARWMSLFRRLAADGLLEPRADPETYPRRLAGERTTLIHRYGRATTDRALAARADAVAVIEGSGPVADVIGELLDAAGIGRIHQIASAGAADAASAAHDGLNGRTAPRVRHRPPASQERPNITVLVGPGQPSAGRVAALVSRVAPHLPVQVTSSRLVVGPLVLPGRSTCINCIDRHRLDVDPDWLAVAAAMPTADPSPILAHSAATLAAGQVLDLVDSLRRPVCVDGTVELAAGSIHPRRRAWSMHAECRCRLVASAPMQVVSATAGPAGI